MSFTTKVAFDHIRNTAAGFTAANPVVGYGVIAYETDTYRAKLGDGVTAYNSLTYFSGSTEWAALLNKPASFAPSQHASSHGTGGSDAVQLAVAQVTGLRAELDGKAALGSFATLNSPAFTGTPTVPSPASGNISQQIPTTAFVGTADAAVQAYAIQRSNHTGTQSAGTITGLGAVATSNNYSDLTGKPTIPSEYTLPVATASVLGGVKQGSNVTIGGDGTISVAAPVTSLPYSSITGTPTLATVATSGSYSDLTGTPSAYTLPVATSSVLGGVKQGSNTTIAGDGTISVAAPVTSLPYASITGTPTLATVATSGLYADLTSKPTLGTSSSLDVAAAGDATSGQVVKGNDTRLSDSRTPSSTLSHTHGNITNAGAIGSTSGQIVVTTTSGVLTTAASIASSAVTGLATVATSGLASDLTGTLADARLSANIPTISYLDNWLGGDGTAVEVFPSMLASGSTTFQTGNMWMTFFTPLVTKTITTITMYSSSVASSGLTLSRFGLYTFDGTTATLVARTASNTANFAAINTAYSRVLASAGGYPTSYTLTAGTKYGVAVLNTGTTMGNMTTRVQSTGLSANITPRVSGQVLSQTDLPTSCATTGTLVNNGTLPFARFT